MPKPFKRTGKILIFLTAAVMLAVLLPSLDEAELTVNAVSLKHIEEIVAQSGQFHILEIVPDEKNASVGYYVDGQEPIAGWKTELADTPTPAARYNYVNTLFGRLGDRGVLGGIGDTAAPLRNMYYDAGGGSYYGEKYYVGDPLTVNGGGAYDPNKWTLLDLSAPETVTLTGTMTPRDGGGFRGVFDYTPELLGGYVQKIRYFVYTQTPVPEDGVYYYDPLFLPVTPATNLSGMLDYAVYELDGDGRYAVDPDKRTVQDYIDAGGFDISDFVFDDPDTYRYFYVDPALTGPPGDYHYRAVPDYTDGDDAPHDGFTDVPTGLSSYFSRTVTSYVYIVSGGNYAYSESGGVTYEVLFNTVYYKAGFASNNLLKKQVFGLEESGLGALGVTVTVRKASEVTAEDIENAGLIYLSAGTDITEDGVTAYSALNDLSGTLAVPIYNFAADGNPVIVDYPIVDGITQGTDTSAIEKLCLLCLQPTLAETTAESLDELTVSWPALSYLAGDGDRTFVNNNVYCFDAFNTDSPSGAPDVGALVTALFNRPFSEQVVSDGFSPVLAEIINENFLLQIAGVPDRIPETVTVSSAVRHIINYKGRRELNAKTSVTVLDLEPAKVTSNTWLKESDVLGWLPPLQEGEVYPDITVVHLTTGEFIGRIEDIVETYDMLYIGMSTESFNTSGGETRYNDPSMYGLVYSNIGDLYRGSMELSGIRTRDYLTADGVRAVDGSTDTTANLFRFSGNDITASKVAELEKFAQAGYPIILGAGFTAGGAVNADKVDCRSYMYRAISGLLGPSYPNVMSRETAAADRELVKKHLNVSKPSIKLSEQIRPPEYTDSESETLTGPHDGYKDDVPEDECNNHRYLTYGFSIGNVTDPTPISTTYDCRLYIDINADGRYYDNEELGDVEIRRVSDGALVLPQKAGDGREFYTLSAGADYTAARQMPDDYVGIIPWKLEVVKNDAAQIHASQQGYTRIAAGGAYETVRVLQIMQAGTSGTKLNLAAQLVSRSTGYDDLLGDDGRYYTGIYGKLIADLDDFRVLIDVIETDDLEAKKTVPGTPPPPASSDNIFTYLNGYDMLIIGFNDCYDGIGAYSADAIVSYIESGKSVLFTHDTTSLTQTEPNAGHPGAYPLAELPATNRTLSDSYVVWNGATNEYKSIDGKVSWLGAYSAALPPNLKQADPTYIIFVPSATDSGDENAYYNARITSGGNYQIYEVNNIGGYADVAGAQVSSASSLEAFRLAHPGARIVYVGVTGSSGWYGTGTGNRNRYQVTLTAKFTMFANGARYVVGSGPQFSASEGTRPNDTTAVGGSSYVYFAACLGRTGSPATSYYVAGTFDGVKKYSIGGSTYYQLPQQTFPQKNVWSYDPYTDLTLTWKSGSITDWGYYFNTVIRDWVGLDRYGVTSADPLLKSYVDSTGPMGGDGIAYVLEHNRSVAFHPKSTGAGTTVPEFQGYTNYALIRFAGSGNTYRYTNNNYANRETTNVSQVNKGQITSYPYNVNTADFGGTDADITEYGGSYMKIGKTHEQYFQINMNTDDIVVWYCMSNYSGRNPDTGEIAYDLSSYYDDVPNDCCNAYYIYNKGNVTYSGVGHTSNAGYYTGEDIGQEYINEAKLFVNTMIAAYQSAPEDTAVSIKQDAHGTSDIREKYLHVDIGNATVVEKELGPTDDGRAVYFRIYDTNVEDSKSIGVTYYVADPAGEVLTDDDGQPIKDEHGQPVRAVVLEKDGSGGAPVTYEAGGVTEAASLKGGYIYKFFLPNADCLSRLTSEAVDRITIYVVVTTTISQADGAQLTKIAYDSIDIKKQQLFSLS